MTPGEFLVYLKRALHALPCEYRRPWSDWRNDKRLYERVLAYELYHQLRCTLPRTELMMNGEPGKGYRRERGIRRKVPDFIYHVPGRDDCNLAVMEVKAVPPERLGDYKKDLQTLHRFKQELQYQLAILVVFGRSRRLGKALEKIQGMTEGVGEEIVVLGFDLGDGVTCCRTIHWQPEGLLSAAS